MIDTVVRFVKNLNSAFGNRMPAETLAVYEEKLGRYQHRHHLPEDVWAKAMSRLVSEHDRLPTLASIFIALGSIETKPTQDHDWIYFTLDGKRYAVRVRSWLSPPTLPTGATDIHRTPFDPADYKPITGSEARAAFTKGYLESGGKLEDLDRLYSALQPDYQMPEDI